MLILVVFVNGGGLLFMSFYTIITVNVCVCNLHSLHRMGHIGNYKQHTADLQLVALFLSQ